MDTHQDIGISIIIPMYNAGLYLHDCLSSLMQSIPPNCEIIIIDDGSTDNSQEICDKFFDDYFDQPFRMIFQENSGVGAARNKGISLATKEYICFLDADDRCAPEMHQKLLAEALKIENGADLCYCGFGSYNHDMTLKVNKLVYRNYMTGKGSDVEIQFIMNNIYIGISTYIVKRDIVVGHRLAFSYVSRYGEDDEFTFKCLLHSDKVSVVPEALFHYRLSPNSAMARIDFNRFDTSFGAIRMREYVAQFFPENETLIDLFDTVYIPMCILNTFHVLAKNKQPYAEIIEFIEKNGFMPYIADTKLAYFTITRKCSLMLWRISPHAAYRLIGLKHTVVSFAQSAQEKIMRKKHAS